MFFSLIMKFLIFALIIMPIINKLCSDLFIINSLFITMSSIILAPISNILLYINLGTWFLNKDIISYIVYYLFEAW